MIKILPDKAIRDQIAEIDRLRDQCGAVKLPVSISLALRKNSRKKSSYASNRIEGNPLTEAEASEAIESSKRHYLKPEQEIRNYYDALLFLQKAREAEAPFSRELILDVQKRVVAGESQEKIGIRGPMPPGVLFAVYDEKTGHPDYIPPESSDIEPLLKELVDYVSSSGDHPLIKAAIVHYQLVSIHPFEDGNGRTARLMSDYMRDLCGYGFGNLGSLEEYFAYDVDEYYRSLQMDLPPLFYDGRENPPHPEIWIGYFLRMMILYAKKVAEISFANAVNDLTPSLTHLSIKERRFFDYLKKNRIEEFAPIEMAKVMKVTNRTIINWAVALAKNGLLEPQLVQKRVRSYRVVMKILDERMA